MADDYNHGETLSLGLATITTWFPNFIDTQVDLIADTFSSLTKPRPNPKPKPVPEFPVLGPSQLLRRVGYGILGALYVGMVLTMVMASAVILGVLVVGCFLEEPVVVRERLHFDFTQLNPQAAFVFGVPVGHTFYVSLELLVPDSDYNRDIGVFQIMAEVISPNGKIIATSSKPSMLQYRSHPIRLMRTLIMGFPLLLGLTSETQKIKVQMLEYKEDSHTRTEAIMITLMPRAGTPYLPQLYEAEIVMHSRLPKVKELVYNWKWTFYVWTSLHIYVMLLALILCFLRPLLVFPGVGEARESPLLERETESRVRNPEDREFAETLREWQQYRKKRKAELLSNSSVYMESISLTPPSSYTIDKEDTCPLVEEEQEDAADSESVCLDK